MVWHFLVSGQEQIWRQAPQFTWQHCPECLDERQQRYRLRHRSSDYNMFLFTMELEFVPWAMRNITYGEVAI